MIVCIFVESSECFKERVKDWFKERKVQVRFVESDANVDKLTELLFEHARDDTRLLLVLGGVDVKSKAVSSIAVKRISDGRDLHLRNVPVRVHRGELSRSACSLLQPWV
jgi:hypothetical protein